MTKKLQPSKSKPQRVAIIFDDNIDRDDGVQQYIKTIATELDRLSIAVEVWCSDGDDKHLANAPNVRVRRLSKSISISGNGNRLKMPMAASARLIDNAFEEFKPDVIHVQVPYSPLLAGRVITRARRLKIRIVGTFHIHAQDKLFMAANKALALAQKRTLDMFDEVVSVSPAARDYCKSIYGLDTKVIPNAVEPDGYEYAQPDESIDGEYFLFLGRLVDRKGPHLLLDAMEQVLADIPDAKVLFASDGPMRDELESRASAMGKKGQRIKFLGHVSEEYKMSLLAGAKVVAFPAYKGESFGIVLIEAFASGGPKKGPLVVAGHNDGYDYVMAGAGAAWSDHCAHEVPARDGKPTKSKTPAPKSSDDLKVLGRQLVQSQDRRALASKLIDTWNIPASSRSQLLLAQYERLCDFTAEKVVSQLFKIYR